MDYDSRRKGYTAPDWSFSTPRLTYSSPTNGELRLMETRLGKHLLGEERVKEIEEWKVSQRKLVLL